MDGGGHREGEGMSPSDEERRGWGIGFGGRKVSGLGGQEGEAVLPGRRPGDKSRDWQIPVATWGEGRMGEGVLGPAQSCLG